MPVAVEIVMEPYCRPLIWLEYCLSKQFSLNFVGLFQFAGYSLAIRFYSKSYSNFLKKFLKEIAMKKILIILALVIVTWTAKTQSLPSFVVGSSGDYFASSSGSLSWTLGEIMNETYQQSSGFLTQGFHQPEKSSITGLDEIVEKNLVVYPNPVREFLNLKTTESGDYIFELFDMQGQRIIEQNAKGVIGDHIHQMDLQEFRVALYLLRITNTRTGKNSSHKIEKY